MHRLLSGRTSAFSYSTDGAETGKLLVAEGLGATVLPDFGVVGYPLERSGTLVCRPIADDTTRVLLMLQRRRADSVPRAARDLQRPSYAGHGSWRRPDGRGPAQEGVSSLRPSATTRNASEFRSITTVTRSPSARRAAAYSSAGHDPRGAPAGNRSSTFTSMTVGHLRGRGPDGAYVLYSFDCPVPSPACHPMRAYT